MFVEFLHFENYSPKKRSKCEYSKEDYFFQVILRGELNFATRHDVT